MPHLNSHCFWNEVKTLLSDRQVGGCPVHTMCPQGSSTSCLWKSRRSLGSPLTLIPPQNVTDLGGTLKYGDLSIHPFPGCGLWEKSALFVSQREVKGMTAEGEKWQDAHMEKTFGSVSGLFYSYWCTQKLFLSVCVVPEWAYWELEGLCWGGGGSEADSE